MQNAAPLLDADSHVNPPPTFWNDYLPPQLRGRGPQLEPGGPDDDSDWIVFEGTRKKLQILGAVAGRKVEDYKMTGRDSDRRKGNWDPAARLDDMAADGVTTAVVFGGGPLGTADNELYLASFEAYNRWVADFSSYDRRRLVGVGYVPMQDIDQSIAMLKDAAGRGLRAINIPAFPQTDVDIREIGGGFAAQAFALTGDPNGARQYDDPVFDPFWKAAVDHDVAITIHLGARVARPGVNRFLPNLVMSKVSMAEPIATLIFGGVFERFPELRFGSIESSVGWFAWMAEYMDAIWKNQRHWTENSLTKPPSFYMDRNIYGSFIRDPVGVANRHRVGGRNIMWSSDYPHSETTWPRSREEIERSCAGLSEEERRPIVHDVAHRFYGL